MHLPRWIDGPLYRAMNSPRARSSNFLVLVAVGTLAFVFWVMAFVNPSPGNLFLALLAPIVLVCVVARFTRLPLDEAERRAARRLHQPPGVNPHVDRNLIRVNGQLRERLVCQWRQHPMMLTPWFAGWAAGTLLTFVLVRQGLPGSWGFGILLVLALVMGARYWEWRRSVYAVTNRRIMRISGIFTIRLDVMAINKLTDQGIDKPWWSLLLAQLRIIEGPVGTLAVETAGQAQQLERIKFVPWVDIVGNSIQHYALPKGYDDDGGNGGGPPGPGRPPGPPPTGPDWSPYPQPPGWSPGPPTPPYGTSYPPPPPETPLTEGGD
jgi:hypothetical protein